MRAQRLAALVSLALLATVVAPVAAQQPGGAAADRYVVVFHDSVSRPAEAAAEMGREHGLEVGFIYQHAFKGFAAAVPAGRVAALQRDPRVAWIEADRLFTISAEPTYETGVERIESDRNAAGSGGTNWASTAPVIAVLDTGVSHSDVNVARRYDCTGGGPFRSSCTLGAGEDGHGHGTHVAGTAAAIKNGSGVIGVAPGAPVWSIKVLSDSGSGYTSWIAAGIDITAANSATVAVANMSLGGSGSDDGNCGNSNNDAMHKAICAAVNKGVVYVVAAGNSAANAANYVPASYDEVITVSAVADFNGRGGGGAAATCRADVDDTFADFSNFGADVDIAAPGVCITSTWNDGGLSTISGTSMASPHAAGVAAMYVAMNGKPTNKAGALAVRDALVSAGYPQADAACGFSGDPDSSKEPLVNADARNVGGSGNPCDSTLGPTDAPPSVGITAPTEGSTVSGTSVTVSATASDDTAVDQVEFFVDGASIGLGSNTADSWSIDWDLAGVADGAHTLTATASDTADQTASDAISVTVDNVNDAPAASFTFVCSGLTCEFDGSSSTDDRGIASYAWDFGDETNASGATATHTFAAADTYTVTLTVTDGEGRADSDSKSVTVTDAPATMHVADLSGFATSLGNTWTATITITVLDSNGKPVSDATVTGSWSHGTLATGSCSTDSNGQCSVTSGSIAKRQGSVTFLVTGISHTTLSYDKTANVETSITVAKP